MTHNIELEMGLVMVEDCVYGRNPVAEIQLYQLKGKPPAPTLRREDEKTYVSVMESNVCKQDTEKIIL